MFLQRKESPTNAARKVDETFLVFSCFCRQGGGQAGRQGVFEFYNKPGLVEPSPPAVFSQTTGWDDTLARNHVCSSKAW